MQKAQGAKLGLLTLLTVTRSICGSGDGFYASRPGLLGLVGWARIRRR